VTARQQRNNHRYDREPGSFKAQRHFFPGMFSPEQALGLF
jgi:hypothetical protein